MATYKRGRKKKPVKKVYIKKEKREKKKKGTDLPIVHCPYCGIRAELRDASDIYGRQSSEKLWVCKNHPACDAYITTKKNSIAPAGRMANGELRKMRIKAHMLIQAMVSLGILNNDRRYDWVQEIMSKSERDAHIRFFDETECQYLIDACEWRIKKENCSHYVDRRYLELADAQYHDRIAEKSNEPRPTRLDTPEAIMRGDNPSLVRAQLEARAYLEVFCAHGIEDEAVMCRWAAVKVEKSPSSFSLRDCNYAECKQITAECIYFLRTWKTTRYTYAEEAKATLASYTAHQVGFTQGHHRAEGRYSAALSTGC